MCSCVEVGLLFFLAALTIDLWMGPAGPCDRDDPLRFLNDACLLERFSVVRNLERRYETLVDGDLLYLEAGLRAIEDRCRAIGKNSSACDDLMDEMEAWLAGAQAFASQFE